MIVTANYQCGTYRTISPEETLQRITPYLYQCGITRCTSITQLDTLGVPTYCAIRPDASLLQVSNGKGLTDVAAKVSALMEAIELFHAENPFHNKLRQTHAEELRDNGESVLNPNELWGFHNGYYSERFVMDWTAGENLHSGLTTWVPASAVYFYRSPSLYNTATNGLASGNHIDEATLHSLYELIERDAMSRLFEDGKLHLREKALVIDPRTIDFPELSLILERVEADRTKVVLLRLNSVIPVHTFWAIFLSREALSSLTMFNVGWGTHTDKGIAAARALTEAAQSRLAAIHGAREDILSKPAYNTTQVQDSPAYRFFDSLSPNTSWSDIDTTFNVKEATDLHKAVNRITNQLVSRGLGPIIRFDLTHPDKNIPVVKIITPRLQFNRRLF
jgi:ribosomal protein S12 methylthiotransferase accessory factor